MLGARTAHAEPAEVTVQCSLLSPEEAAQVEARVRADVLGAETRPTKVELGCDAESLQVRLSGAGRTLVLRASGNAAFREALLASAEAALSGWSGLATPVAAFPPPTPAPVPQGAGAVSPTSPSRTPRTITVTAPLHVSSPTPCQPGRLQLAFGVRGEPWRRAAGLGVQLGFEHALPSAWVAAQAVYLSALPAATRFAVHEWQMGAELGWQPRGTAGVRVAVAVGLSLLEASSGPEVTPLSATTSTLAFGGLNLSRPFDFGSLAAVPAVGFRVFSRERAVKVDSRTELALPSFVLHASFSVALRLGS